MKYILVFALVMLYLFCLNASQVSAGDYHQSSGDWHVAYEPMAKNYRERYKEEPSTLMLHKIEGFCGGLKSENYECWDKVRTEIKSRTKKK